MAVDLSGYMLFVRTYDPSRDRFGKHSSDHVTLEDAQRAWRDYCGSVPNGQRIVEAVILPPGARKGNPNVVNLLAA